jgi:hypothetical protein
MAARPEIGTSHAPPCGVRHWVSLLLFTDLVVEFLVSLLLLLLLTD